MMKFYYFAAALMLAAASTSSAAISLQFNQSGYLGESGQTSGIFWGMVFDVGADGFDSVSAGTVLSDGNTLSGSDDDLFFVGGLTTAPVPGTVDGVIDQRLNFGPSSIAGKNFYLIWFDSTISSGDTLAGSNTYGMQGTYVAPSDSGTGNTYSTSPGGNANLAIPEPSAALLSGLGLMLLLRRRRNNED